MRLSPSAWNTFSAIRNLAGQSKLFIYYKNVWDDDCKQKHCSAIFETTKMAAADVEPIVKDLLHQYWKNRMVND